MQKKIDLVIEGSPVAWKSHGGYGRKSFNPRFKEREYFKWCIKSQYRGPLIEGPVRVDMIFLFEVPKSVSKKRREKMISRKKNHTVRPDRGNCLKFTEDCLIGTVIVDDSQIVAGEVQKFWAEKSLTFIRLTEMEDD